MPRTSKTPREAASEVGAPELHAQLPPQPLRIYVNRDLRLDGIRYIGFDMDHTLARYRRASLETLAHRLTIDKLIARGYPTELRSFTYDPSFVIRGLTVDKQLGNILKLDAHGHVGRVFHGRRALSKKERRSLYRSEMLRFVPPRFALVDTLYSLPEMCLYADLVDYFDAHEGPRSDPWRLFEDTRDSIDEAHRDGTLKSAVQSDLSTYLERDPRLPRTLHKLRSAGKKLFLLTNSHWEYTDAVMSYLLEDQLSDCTRWRQYFHAVVVSAGKPGFFVGDEPLTEIDPAGRTVKRPVCRIERGKIYLGGNLTDFERAIRASGDNILYVGDHIYADILRSKKSSLWRTALIVEELEDELSHWHEHRQEAERMERLEIQRRQLDDRLNLLRMHLSSMEQQDGTAQAKRTRPYREARQERERTKRALKAVVAELDRIERRYDEAFNPYWGMLFKEARENSRFGEQVTSYACLYTSRVSNFLSYSSFQYFRTPRARMPHEID